MEKAPVGSAGWVRDSAKKAPATGGGQKIYVYHICICSTGQHEKRTCPPVLAGSVFI